MRILSKKFLACFVGMALALFFSANLQSDPLSELDLSAYKLHVEDMELTPEPLPRGATVFVEEYDGDELVKKDLAYKVWDIDRNSKIDMVQVLDKNGNVFKVAYDFDQDGHLDEIVLLKKGD